MKDKPSRIVSVSGFHVEGELPPLTFREPVICICEAFKVALEHGAINKARYDRTYEVTGCCGCCTVLEFMIYCPFCGNKLPGVP